MKWKRVRAGIYETANGRFRVQISCDRNEKPNGWQLLEWNGATWVWWNTFSTKSEAQDIAMGAK